MKNFIKLKTIREDMNKKYSSQSAWLDADVLDLGRMIRGVSKEDDDIIVANVIRWVYKWEIISKRYLDLRRG